jgi:hypothetical protein
MSDTEHSGPPATQTRKTATTRAKPKPSDGLDRRPALTMEDSRCGEGRRNSACLQVFPATALLCRPAAPVARRTLTLHEEPRTCPQDLSPDSAGTRAKRATRAERGFDSLERSGYGGVRSAHGRIRRLASRASSFLASCSRSRVHRELVSLRPPTPHLIRDFVVEFASGGASRFGQEVQPMRARWLRLS